LYFASALAAILTSANHPSDQRDNYEFSNSPTEHLLTVLSAHMFFANITQVLRALKQKKGKIVTEFSKWRAEAQLTQKIS
jgi:hypothetical protein